MKYRILVVDDSLTVRNFVESILSEFAEFDVEYFESARSAYHRIIMLKRENIDVDVVLTDIILKSDDISGQELLKKLVVLKFYIGVIVMSSRLAIEDFYELIISGADDYLALLVLDLSSPLDPEVDPSHDADDYQDHGEHQEAH